ncbi:MAG: FixH [Bacteroidota bacterium]
MNFKYFILALYLTFVGLIVMMVFKSCGQNIELETQDYYNEELKYQQKIDALKLGSVYKDSVKLLANDSFVFLQMPQSIKADSMILVFMKPDDSKADVSIKLTSTQGVKLDPTLFATGIYNLSINLYDHAVYTLIEKQIQIQ